MTSMGIANSHWILSPFLLPEGGISQASKQIKRSKHQQRAEHTFSSIHVIFADWLADLLSFPFSRHFNLFYRSLMASKHSLLHFFHLG